MSQTVFIADVLSTDAVAVEKCFIKKCFHRQEYTAGRIGRWKVMQFAVQKEKKFVPVAFAVRRKKRLFRQRISMPFQIGQLQGRQLAKNPECKFVNVPFVERKKHKKFQHWVMTMKRSLEKRQIVASLDIIN